MKQIILCLMGALGATLWIGCGGDVGSGAGGSGTGSASTAGTGGASMTTGTEATTSAGSTGTGSGTQSGDCATDTDCPGSKCAEVTPGGFKVCLNPPKEVMSCQVGDGGCCSSADCAGAGEKCYAPFGYCGGIIGPANQCLSDQCQTNSDCAGDPAVCVKAGMLGYPINACAPAHCQLDSECNAMAGGRCAPVKMPCCTTRVELYCVYSNGGCRTDKDCDAAKPFCVIEPTTQLPQCSAQQAPCPL
jgi:hypothetical protein